IEETANRISPKSLAACHRRLFSERDFELYEEKGNFEERNHNLNLRRQAAVREIYEQHETAGIFEFVQQVDSPNKVGYALGCLEDVSEDHELLPNLLDHKEKAVAAF